MYWQWGSVVLALPALLAVVPHGDSEPQHKTPVAPSCRDPLASRMHISEMQSLHVDAQLQSTIQLQIIANDWLLSLLEYDCTGSLPTE